MNCSWHSQSLNQWKRISIAFVRFGCILTFTTASSIELSVCNGVGGCLCPISSKMVLMYTASLSIMYNATNYDSVADDMTCFIMCNMLRNDLLFCGMVEPLDREKWLPALLRAFGSLRYLASMCATNFMSFALNVSTASSCVAM